MRTPSIALLSRFPSGVTVWGSRTGESATSNGFDPFELSAVAWRLSLTAPTLTRARTCVQGDLQHEDFPTRRALQSRHDFPVRAPHPLKETRMNRRMIGTAVAAALVAAVPVQGAVAKPGGHESHGAKGKCAKLHAVGFSAAGTLTGYTADSVTLDVKRANKHARGYIDAAGSTFSLSGARVKFAGVTDA